MEISKEQKLLLNLIAMSLSDQPEKLKLSNEELSGVDFVKVAKESIYQAVTVQAFNSAWFYKDVIPAPIFTKWQEFVVNAMQSNLKVIKAQDELVSLLDKNGFKYAIIKGTSASSYYSAPFDRKLGDVDFLIDPNDQSKIEKVLIENGYQKDPMAHISHVVFKKPDAHLEMHFEVAGLPENEHKDRVRKFVFPTVFTAVDKAIENSTFKSPTDLYHGVIILLHTQHHLLGEGLGLRHLCDLATFVQKTHDEPFWTEELLPLAKEIGLYKFLCVMVKTCVKHLKIENPSWLEDFESPTPDEVISDIITSGNLGQKDDVRAKSGALLAKKGEKKRGAILTLAISLNKAVLLKYPIVKKVWILYPFVYIFKAIQNVLRMIFKKRTSISQMIPEAKKRQALYDKLDVYKTKEN